MRHCLHCLCVMQKNRIENMCEDEKFTILNGDENLHKNKVYEKVQRKINFSLTYANINNFGYSWYIFVCRCLGALFKSHLA